MLQEAKQTFKEYLEDLVLNFKGERKEGHFERALAAGEISKDFHLKVSSKLAEMAHELGVPKNQLQIDWSDLIVTYTSKVVMPQL